MTDGGTRGATSAGFLLLGAVIGIILLGAARFVAQPPEQHVHYHANWALVVDGERLDLTANRYMEDVGACSADPTRQRPQDRVHMHENNQDVVHVHDSGATWGHLLANLGFGIGDDYLQGEGQRYVTGADGTLKFILNGAEIRSIRNQVVQDEDRLLISYGPESVEEVVASQFPQVGSNAGEFNVMPDPASCAGQEEMTFGDRLRRAFWW